eukprot:scaffold189287_cov26-Attheya_sp.AAC.1
MEEQERKKERLDILTVGDGDLTFTLALVRAYGTHQLNVVGSTLLEDEVALVETYPNSKQVLEELTSLGVVVKFGMDATRLDQLQCSSSSTTTTTPPQLLFDIIFFNHPHLGWETNGQEAADADAEARHAQRHHALLAHYFASALPLLSPMKGRVHVCLCGRQPETWKVETAATTTISTTLEPLSSSASQAAPR